MVDKFKTAFLELITSDIDGERPPGLSISYLATLGSSDIEFKDSSEGSEKKIEIVIKTKNAAATSLITKSPENFTAIKELLLKRFPGTVISYRVAQDAETKQNDIETRKTKAPVALKSQVTGKHLIRSLTFDNFITGESNEEAYNICKRIAENPKKWKNVLLLYSKPALGKTHLVSAIANYIEEFKTGARVYFFKKNDFISSLLGLRDKDRTVSRYIDDLISADIVIFDDVQMLFDRTMPFALDVFYDMVDARVNTDQPLTTIFTADKLLSDYRIEISADSLTKEQDLRLHFEYQELEKKLYKTLAPRITTRVESGRTIELSPPNSKMKELWMLNYFESESISIEKENMDQLRYVAIKGPANFRDLRNICEKVKDRVLDRTDVGGALASVVESFEAPKNKEVRKAYVESIIQDIISFTGITKSDLEKQRIRDPRVIYIRDMIFHVLLDHLSVKQAAIAETFKVSKAIVSMRIKEFNNTVRTAEQQEMLNKILVNLRLVSN